MENGFQNCVISTSLVFYFCHMMEDKLLGTFKIVKAIQKDQLFAKIGQNFNLG